MAIQYLETIKPNSASVRVKKVYEDLQNEMGDVVEPISLHAILPDVLEQIWGILRETLLVDDQLNRSQKEAIAAAVSHSNRCTYCVDAHTIMLIGLKDKAIADAILKDNPQALENGLVKDLILWSLNSKEAVSHATKNPPFDLSFAPEAIGTLVLFNYLNRVVTIFLGKTILPLNVQFLKGMMRGVAAKMFSKVLASEKKKGEFKEFDPTHAELQWASKNSRIYSKFYSFHQQIDMEMKRFFPKEIIEFVKAHIDDWNGKNDLNPGKLEQITAHLPVELRPIARMLYLTCFDPFRIQKSQIEQILIRNNENDKALLTAVSWASFMMSCKIGKELYKAFEQ